MLNDDGRQSTRRSRERFTTRPAAATATASASLRRRPSRQVERLWSNVVDLDFPTTHLHLSPQAVDILDLA